jgi:hypothetical protein
MSALARSLVKQWRAEPAPPSYLQMLNMLARALGHSNFQAFRATAPDAAAPSADAALTRRLLRYFDTEARLCRWPAKLSLQQICLWPIWARIPARCVLAEADVNRHIQATETIGDHVLLRRELVNCRMLGRNADSSAYHRIEQPPPPEGLALIRGLSGRRAS